jgi:hypothetical protein
LCHFYVSIPASSDRQWPTKSQEEAAMSILALSRRRIVAGVVVAALPIVDVERAASAALQPADETSAYLAAVAGIAEMLDWAAREQNTLLNELDGTTLQDEEWRIDFLSAYDVPKAAQEAVSKLTPPASLQDPHNALVRAIGYFILAGGQSRMWILESDQGAFQKASIYMQRYQQGLASVASVLPHAINAVDLATVQLPSPPEPTATPDQTPVPALEPTEPIESIQTPTTKTRKKKKASQAPPTEAPTPVPIPLGTSADQPAPFTQPLAGGGVKVQLSNGRFENKFGFSKPKGGYKYLAFDARIEGDADDERFYSPSSFSGQDADTGAGYDSELTFEQNELGSDSLSRGEFVTGMVVLEVQETATRVIIKYDPLEFDPNDLYWIYE